MKHFILIFFMLVIASCSSQSGKRQTQLEVSANKTSSNYVKAPTYIVLNNKSAFEFVDKQNLIGQMKSSGLDSILLTRTTEVHSNPIKEDHFGDWIIPFDDNRFDTIYVENYKKDTVTTMIETITLPARAFKLKE